MSILTFIGGILGNITAPVVDYFKEGQMIKAAKVERKDVLTKLKLETTLESIRNAEATNLQLDEMNGSDPIKWANDVSFIIFLAPAVLCFYPPAIPHIQAGFLAISEMPLFWQYGLGMMLVSVWGYRNLVEPIIKSIAKVWLGKKV